jgi:hypothetical protein
MKNNSLFNRKGRLAFGPGIFASLAVGSISIHDIVVSTESNRWARQIKQVIAHLLALPWKPRRES